MREIRQSGSEGGRNEFNRFSLPLSTLRTAGFQPAPGSRQDGGGTVYGAGLKTRRYGRGIVQLFPGHYTNGALPQPDEHVVKVSLGHRAGAKSR